jgi:hypothetical protein
MTKIIISITAKPQGLSVDCEVEPENDDTSRVQHIASVVALGLSTHVGEKIRKAINKKEEKNVH